VNRSIAEASAAPAPLPRMDAPAPSRSALGVGAGLVVAFFLLYFLTRPYWPTVYNHFVWQADAYLHGQVSIQYPVAPTATTPGNDFFNDVVPVVDAAGNETGRGMIPFPPLPAVILLPFVAIWGMATDETLLAVVLGALDVGVAFWLLGRLPVRAWLRAALTIFLGAGTALWYASSLGTTWFLAHVVAVGLTLAAVAIALDADDRSGALGPGEPRPILDRRQVAAGLLLGLAVTSRLTVVFGAVFLLFVGGGSWTRRATSAALGMAIPVGALLVYNLVVSGTLFNPVYESLYQYEVWAYPELNYHAAWALQDIRYIPQNLGIMLGGLPDIMPTCDAGVARELWSSAGCSWLVPNPVGMSLLLTSPAWLVAAAALPLLRDRRVLGGFLATIAIAIVNLMHFSQGWVQFGYRFSLDFAPFLLVPLALGAERLVARHGRRAARGGLLVGGLIAVSIAVETWGLVWARVLGW
jgi:hypothetical protein